jgi:methylglyoxal synthase
MPAAQTIILLAHKRLIKPLAGLIKKRLVTFEGYRLISTSETGEQLEEMTGLEITHVFPARKGGDMQLCGLVCSNTIRAVIFLRDPLNTDPSEADITPFYRACDLNNVPLATNVVSAAAITLWLGRKDGERTSDG